VNVEAVVAADSIDAAFDRFLAVDDRSWKKRDGSVLRHDSQQRAALLGAMRLAAREGRAAFHFLRVNGEEIAAQLCVLIDGQLQLVKTSYDEEWANFGVGKLLLAETIRKWCPANGVHALNLVTGLQWHLQWQPRCIQTHGLWLLAPGVRGRVAGVQDVPARVNAKRLLQRVGLEDQARNLLRRGKTHA
jgi:CelD/BcsL family acetyltransferase involved in cellulose biosynthesis